MTRPHTIIGSALATAAINLLVALVVIFALPSHEARVEPRKLNESAPLFQLSPIPAGADWGRS